MTDAQASALPRLSVGDRVRVIARLDIPNPHDLPIGYVGVVEEVFPNGDVDLGEWACRRDEIELAGDEPARAASAPTGDMVLAADASPRDPRIKVIADAMSAKRQDLIAQPLSFIWEALAEAALTAAPSPSASTMGVKELVWAIASNSDYGDPLFAQAWVAAGLKGFYQLERRMDGQFTVWFPLERIGQMFASEAGAKAAAQADFTRRIQSCLPSAGGEGTVEAHARLPVARIIDDNQPGATAIVKIVCDPPTLGVGTLLYSRPRDHAAELVEAYCAGQRDAILSPSKAETETVSERERLVEAAKTVVRMGQIDPSGRDLSWRLQMQQSIEDLAAALAQEPAR